jgi:hypothetical protein
MADMTRIADRSGNGRDPSTPKPAKQGNAGKAYEQPLMNQGGRPSMDRGLRTTGCEDMNTSIKAPGSGTSGDGTTARKPKSYDGIAK